MMMSVSLQFLTSATSTSASLPSSSSSSSSLVIALIRSPSIFPYPPTISPPLKSPFLRPRFSILPHHHRHHHYHQKQQQKQKPYNGSVDGCVVGGARPLCMRKQCYPNNNINGLLQNSNSFPSSLQQQHHYLMSSRKSGASESEVPCTSGSSSEASSYDGVVVDPFRDASCDDECESDVEDEDQGFTDVERWDVLGLGQAMVDFSGVVDEEFLERLGLEKGARKIVNHEERGKVLRAMDGCSYKAAAGGSLSNSLVALARLGSHPVGGPVLNVAMAGSVGSDLLGGFYRNKLRRAGVNFLSAPVKDGTTGTVIVLTTPDAQRTMLAYQGTSSTVNYDPGLSSVISKTNILVIEGYLFEFPDTIKTIIKACKDAHSCGALVAVTASDVTCIQRHYDDFWEVIRNYADIIFANSDEARALCNFSLKENPVSATWYLSHFVPLVSVTDGARGSYIGARGEAVYVPPSPCVPLDTCGAGDAYASGILYGILRGVSDLKDMGSIAARVAAVVVGQQGTRLRVHNALDLAQSFAFHLENSSI